VDFLIIGLALFLIIFVVIVFIARRNTMALLQRPFECSPEKFIYNTYLTIEKKYGFWLILLLMPLLGFLLFRLGTCLYACTEASKAFGSYLLYFKVVDAFWGFPALFSAIFISGFLLFAVFEIILHNINNKVASDTEIKSYITYKMSFMENRFFS
jgi:hypothetical protein